MDALNGMGNQIADSDNLETEVEQIHQIFCMVFLERSNPIFYGIL